MVRLEKRGRVAECRALGNLNLETKEHYIWGRGWNGGGCSVSAEGPLAERHGAG